MGYYRHGVLDQVLREAGVMTQTAVARKRSWQPMRLTLVGDVSMVMQKKTGTQCDPSPNHTIKRGLGPPPANC